MLCQLKQTRCWFFPIYHQICPFLFWIIGVSLSVSKKADIGKNYVTLSQTALAENEKAIDIFTINGLRGVIALQVNFIFWWAKYFMKIKITWCKVNNNLQEIPPNCIVTTYPHIVEVSKNAFEAQKSRFNPDYALQRQMPRRLFETAEGFTISKPRGQWVLVAGADSPTPPYGHLLNHCRKHPNCKVCCGNVLPNIPNILAKKVKCSISLFRRFMCIQAQQILIIMLALWLCEPSFQEKNYVGTMDQSLQMFVLLDTKLWFAMNCYFMFGHISFFAGNYRPMYSWLLPGSKGDIAGKQCLQKGDYWFLE